MGKLSCFSLAFALKVSLNAGLSISSVSAGRIDAPDFSMEHVTIQAHSEKTILQWTDFSNQAGEVLHFCLPNRQSAVLNRVTSQMPSSIMGSLTSNGHVLLVNPNGILFGKEAKVDVAALTASTLDIPDTVFLENKDFCLSGDSKRPVINQGHIQTVGDVFLIASHVANAGVIDSQEGTVHLIAAQNLMIKPDAQKRIFICPGSDVLDGIGINQSGEICAKQIELLADGNAYGLAIKHTGLSQARGFCKEGGRIRLIAEDGHVHMCKESQLIAGGGEIQVLGKHVSAVDQSLADVSSEKKSGKIFVGGSLQGKDRDLLASKSTFLGKDVQLRADGKENGSGGQIVIWSDGDTQFDGLASAQGGNGGGDGGFIEISGKRLIYQGEVNTLAPAGQTGTVLWDPSNIVMHAGTSVENLEAKFDKETYHVFPTAESASFGVDVMNNALQKANIIISTSSGFEAEGNFTISEPVVIESSGHNVTFIADGNFYFGHHVTFNDSTGQADFTIEAGQDFIISKSCGISFAGEQFACNAKGNVQVNGYFEFSNSNDKKSAIFSMHAGESIVLNKPMEVDGAGKFVLECNQMMQIGNSLTTRDVGSASLKTTLPANFDPYDPYSVSPDIFVKPGAQLIIDANQFEMSSAENILMQGQMTSGNHVQLTAKNDLSVCAGAFPAFVSANQSDLTLTAGGRLTVIGGHKPNAYAQIGSKGTRLDSNIQLNVSDKIVVSGSSSAPGGYALIGHQSDGSGHTYLNGNIQIAPLKGSIDILGGAKSGSFAQIGHSLSAESFSVEIQGSIAGLSGERIELGGDLFVRGGFAEGAYALLGHGGSKCQREVICDGSVKISTENINLFAGTNNYRGSFAAAGFYVNEMDESAFAEMHADQMVFAARNTIVVQSQSNNNAALGARVITTDTGEASLQVDQMFVDTAWLALQGGVNQISPNEVFLGVFNGELASLISQRGFAASDLSIHVSESFKMIVSEIGNESLVQGLITNGDRRTGNGYTFDMSVGGEAFICSGNNHAGIRGIDGINFAAGASREDADLVLFAKGRGTAFIDSQNTTSPSMITSGRDIRFVANHPDFPAFIAVANKSGHALTVKANRTINVGAHCYIDHLGSGDLTLVVDNAYSGIRTAGDGAFYLDKYGCVGKSGGGSLRIFTSRRDLNMVSGQDNINGRTFVPGKPFIDSQTEQWNTWYPSAFIGNETYTLFYKN